MLDRTRSSLTKPAGPYETAGFFSCGALSTACSGPAKAKPRSNQAGMAIRSASLTINTRPCRVSSSACCARPTKHSIKRHNPVPPRQCSQHWTSSDVQALPKSTAQSCGSTLKGIWAAVSGMFERLPRERCARSYCRETGLKRLEGSSLNQGVAQTDFMAPC